MKVVFLLILVTLTAGVLSYKFGSTPVALAKARPNPQDASESPVPLTLPTAPAIWSVHSTGANGVAANATRPAGGAGVKHVASCISATFYVQAGGIYHGNGVSLLDGSTTLLYWEFAIPTARRPQSVFAT
jgi:hypothetical protein